MYIDRPKKLEKEHHDFIRDEGTLMRQLSYSLDERAADFMREFPGKKLSSSRLAYIYKKHKIRKKKIGNTKVLN